LLAKFVAFEGARWHSPVFVFPKTRMNGSQWFLCLVCPHETVFKSS
jgi:hypothetical protein